MSHEGEGRAAVVEVGHDAGRAAAVVGLYLDPPKNAVVLCVDEKSQCQALERSQPSLPLHAAAAPP